MRRLLGLAAFLGGCSLFTSIDGVSGGADPSSDDAGGVTTDAASEEVGRDDGGADAVDASAANDGDASLPNLQPNGGFELLNGDGCGLEWGVFQGTPTRVTDARTGTYACKACGSSTSDSNYSLNQNDSAKIVVQPGQRYVVEAWVRALDAASGSQNVRGTIRIYEQGTSNVIQRIDPPLVPVTTTWSRIETTIDIIVTGQFNYYIAFYGGPTGSCAFVDDVVIHRLL